MCSFLCRGLERRHFHFINKINTPQNSDPKPIIFINKSKRLGILFKMALRTYGDKPVSFQLEENGEYYCIGSEVKMGFGILKQIHT